MPEDFAPLPKLAAPHPGERVTLLRGRYHLTQQDLATRATVGIATLRRIEQGVGTPSYATLVALAKALGTDVSYLTKPID